jgi:Zn-dependent protease/CBS domain-containing protein
MMKWSLKLGCVAGIDLYVHATFSLLIIWVAFAYWMQTQSVAATIMGIVFILALFVCVILHELGHALTARRYGVRTRSITLLPIGGVASLEKMPDRPLHELIVALAGPAVNVVIAGLLYLVILVGPGFPTSEEISLTEPQFLIQLFVVNVLLVLFNLLPAFPMDGGRVLRSLLAMKLPYHRATAIAAACGQGMAMLFVFLGFLIPNFVLILIAVFVWLGATSESSAAEFKFTLAGVPVRQAMLTEFKSMTTEDTLARAMDLILAGSQHDFPVVTGGRVEGMLTRRTLMRALAEQGQSLSVTEVMLTEFPTLDADEPLTEAMPRLQGSEIQTLPVMDGSRLIGLLTMENIGEFVMIRDALGQAGRQS